jgi:hypothetical protein
LGCVPDECEGVRVANRHNLFQQSNRFPCRFTGVQLRLRSFTMISHPRVRDAASRIDLDSGSAAIWRGNFAGPGERIEIGSATE